MKITPELVLNWYPCYSPEEIIKMFKGKKFATPLEICDATHVSLQDKLWVLLREQIIPLPLAQEFACKCVENYLPLFEKQYPKDLRPRKAIKAKRDWLLGKIKDNELIEISNKAFESYYSTRGDVENIPTAAYYASQVYPFRYNGFSIPHNDTFTLVCLVFHCLNKVGPLEINELNNLQKTLLQNLRKVLLQIKKENGDFNK